MGSKSSSINLPTPEELNKNSSFVRAATKWINADEKRIKLNEIIASNPEIDPLEAVKQAGYKAHTPSQAKKIIANSVTDLKDAMLAAGLTPFKLARKLSAMLEARKYRLVTKKFYEKGKLVREQQVVEDVGPDTVTQKHALNLITQIYNPAKPVGRPRLDDDDSREFRIDRLALREKTQRTDSERLRSAN